MFGRDALLARQLQDLGADAPRQIGPAVLDQILLGVAAGLVRGEIFEPALLPAWRRDGRKPFWIDRRVGADIDRRRRALENVELFAGARQIRHALHGGGAGADDADALVRQLVHRRARGIAAGVVVIPPAGVERMSLEAFDARYARQFGDVQRPGAHADELRGEGVAAVGVDDPARIRLVPFQISDLGMKQRVVVEAKLRADAPAMREDLGRMRVFLRRHVPGFLEQRHVDHRRRIALRAGIAVPVPGAAEIAALLDDADIPDAGFRQPRGGGKPCKAAADEGEGDVVGFGIARGDRRIGIVEIMGELSLDLDVLVVAVGAQPLVALLHVLLAQLLLVDGLAALLLRFVGDRHSSGSF